MGGFLRNIGIEAKESGRKLQKSIQTKKDYMSALDHWHPVLKSNELKKKPKAIILNGKQIVLFRDKDGLASALDDVCPHRRMALSNGSVKTAE